ncbi:segregation and condensation protein B [Planococcus sp. A6]|uniref:segregation and condensation protein B n=1 Tax=Planococcus sp. A6 TaxID=2992760 RepID=UPI00237B00E5|nr:segregation and condensation protein B [Planococcus sp. A6]MDE0582242.1 segregation and condensation protein B [Planococcus sp. A6]
MFEQNGVTYTLKFTQQKLKTIETITKVSIVGEITRANGFMPYNILESLFSFALIEEQTKEVVKQSKATEMFEKVVEENGLATTNMAIVEKLQEDLGFMFR